MQQSLCTSQLLLMEIILSVCQETISYMQGRVLQANSIQCKLTLSSMVPYLQRNSVYLESTSKIYGSNPLTKQYISYIFYIKHYTVVQFSFRYADQITIDDEVLIPENNEVNPTKVISVSSFVMQGAHVPLTMEGNIIVDGILASCYPSCYHDLVHIVMLPIQLFPTIMEWIFGEDNGFSTYANIFNDLGDWVLPPDYLLETN